MVVAKKKIKHKETNIVVRYSLTAFRDSIVVSISACHADDPGSIPGRGVVLDRKGDLSLREIEIA